MVGRPRKAGKREKNGRIQRVYENPKAQVAAQPHRTVVMMKHRDWPEAESEFGRLMLNGKITPAQYEAGKLYAGLAESYRAVFDIPSGSPSAMDPERTGRSVSQGMPAHIAKSIRDRYDAAFEIIGSNRAQRAVKDAAVMEIPVNGEFALKLLINGLDRLVAHFSLDKYLQITSRQ